VLQLYYLTFINLELCESYSITGKINDEFVDIDASQRFFHLPVQASVDKFNSNKISVKVKCASQNDNFCAVPIFFWKNTTSRYRKRIFLSLNENNFFQNNSIDWLGSQSAIDCNLDLLGIEATQSDQVINDEVFTFKLNVNKNKVLDSLQAFIINFNYQPNSWFVCYKTLKWNDRLSIRIVKSLEFSNIQAQNRFNFVKANNKILPLEKILFFQKINSVWDYIDCLRITQKFSSLVRTIK